MEGGATSRGTWAALGKWKRQGSRQESPERTRLADTLVFSPVNPLCNSRVQKCDIINLCDFTPLICCDLLQQPEGTHTDGCNGLHVTEGRLCAELCPPLLPPSPSLTLLQSHGPPRCSSSMSGMVLPQDLCTFYAFCLAYFLLLPPLQANSSFFKSQLPCPLLLPNTLRGEKGVRVSKRECERLSKERSQAETGKEGVGSWAGQGWGWGAEKAAGPGEGTAGPCCGEPPTPTSVRALAHQHSPEMREVFSLRLTLLAKYNCSSFFLCKKHVHQNRPCGACRRKRPLDLVRELQKELQGDGDMAASSLSAVGGQHKTVGIIVQWGPLAEHSVGVDTPLSVSVLCTCTTS